MKYLHITLLFLMLVASPIGSYAEQPKTGSDAGGGIFLYREAVEIYWNDWIAFPLMKKTEIPTSDQARLTVTGEGKTAAFIGNLSINCENGRHFWESAGSGSEFLTSKKQVEKIVPINVINKAVMLFCK